MLTANGVLWIVLGMLWFSKAVKEKSAVGFWLTAAVVTWAIINLCV